MGKAQLPKLAPVDAFLHLIYDHRYFSLAAWAWRRFGPRESPRDQAQINSLIPGIGVLIQDSLLMHARPLIDFYTANSTDPTDIVLADFGSPTISAAIATHLAAYKDPISVHLMHLTAWRDYDYRSTHHATKQGTTRQRPDWNADNDPLIDSVFAALGEVAAAGVSWSRPFADLQAACADALLDPSTPSWPTHLAEKADVDAYLAMLGL